MLDADGHRGEPRIRGRTLSAWIEALKAPAHRKDALEAIAALGDAGAPAIPAIIRHVKRWWHAGYHHERCVAAVTLGAMGGAAIPSLQGLLEDEATAGTAFMALKQMGAPGRRVFFRALRSSSPVSRRFASRALAKMGPKVRGVVPSLRRALEDEDAGVRGEAAVGLVARGFRQRRLAASLVDLVRDWITRHPEIKDPRKARECFLDDARHGATGGICSIGSAAVPDLIAAIADPDRDVGDWATSALEALGTEAVAAVPPLMHRVEGSRDLHERLSSAEALCGIVPDSADLLRALIKELRGFKGADPAYAAYLLARLGPRAADAVGDLVKALRHRGVYRRSMAAFALKAIAPFAADAIPALETALGDDYPKVRTYAAVALARQGVRTRAVARALGDSLSDTRNLTELREAILALTELGPAARGAVRRLERIATDPKIGRSWAQHFEPIRGLARRALEAIRGP